MHTAVEETVQARLILSTHRSARLRVALSYRPDDPLAVRMAFPAEFSLDEPSDAPGPDGGPDIVWVFARRLLTAGLELPAGVGDVHVRPAIGRRTMVELRAPEGTALVQFDSADLRRFLWRSRLAVPEGEEHLHLDADRALAELLG
ncbi:SsgA family sporulation/cell division regulator [Streptomyces sp. CB01881]|uniref:SsgA family sporulation/cell division regulator n=1 Tax=Streptomyces sp. CB01881 TaxID=2078691 RepID=UPI000CDC94D0|nr:SsgA family sporulation/cell division regulator [Streptomyces sp. CB01881]AUY51566.1 SsgA family sporulation/cell division regulator [Streptomyces sp. CB01881]TYC74958.1 SsgA family sporulation/cell division regulator [Streptomyces sp. CB01881]